MPNITIENLLKTCAEEEIQFLGEIQDFSTLVVLDLGDHAIIAASENAHLTFDKGYKQLLDIDIRDIFSNKDIEQLEKLSKAEKNFNNQPLSLTVFSHMKNFFCYKTGSNLVLENDLKASESNFNQHNSLLASLVNSDSEIENMSITSWANDFSSTLRQITKYDRVMVYKFHEDKHGEVIAEHKPSNVTKSYLGLHYPESDIPSQARDLYVHNTIRVIEDIDSSRVSIYSKKLNVKRIDLTHSLSRHVSPVHIQYLKNMGVKSTLAMSIIVSGKLWGLVVCHHDSEKYISFSDKAFLKIITLSFSARLSELIQYEKSKTLSKSNLLIASMVKYLKSQEVILNSNFLESICTEFSGSLLGLLEANGLYVQMGTQQAKYGTYPGSKVITEIKKFFQDQPDEQVFACESFYERFNLEQTSDLCAGGIAIGFSYEDVSFIVAWFRPEFQDEVRWAGEKEFKTQTFNNRISLSPRSSFEEIKKTKENQSRVFTELDIKVAREFMWFFSKVLADQLIRIDKKLNRSMEESEMKSRFLSNLSHELRTPLNNILGWLQINQIKLSKDKDLLNFFNVVKNNSEQQLRLVNDLLETTRIQTGKIKLNLEALDLSSLTKNILNYFDPSFKNKKISIKLSQDKGDYISRSDRGRIEQVLRNIIQNSLKFTPKYGNISIHLEKQHSDIKIRIKDDGIGIPKTELQKVFEGFYQVDSNSDKSKNRFGLGLGLSLTKHLVELHGGSISVFSEGEGHGTEVTVSLPAATLEPRKETNRSKLKNVNNQSMKKLNMLNILLVEDTIESARFVKLLLEREGAVVSWADTASDALNFLSKSKYDLVISDIGLPVMDGIQFIAEAKKFVDVEKTPFLALSAYGEHDEIKRSLKVGYKQHILKPVNFSDLISSIKEVCRV